MTGPGRRVHAWAARWCSAETMERLIEPALADMQVEYDEARAQRQPLRGYWVWLTGHAALGKAVAVYGTARGRDMIAGMSVDERRGMGRTIVWSVATTIAVTALLMADPLRTELPRHPENALRLALLLIPQALPISIPVGLVVAILQVLRHGALTRASRAAILSLSVVLCIGSGAVLEWVVPDTNQAYREMIFRRMLAQNPNAYPRDLTLPRGFSELTFVQMRRAIDQEKAGLGAEYGGDRLPVSTLELTYYSRWAIVFAPLVLTLFALVVATRLTRSRVWRWLVAAAVIVAYWSVYFIGDRGFDWDRTLPMLLAWAPNIAILIVTVALAKLARPRTTAVA
jgi:hypothetical protein